MGLLVLPHRKKARAASMSSEAFRSVTVTARRSIWRARSMDARATASGPAPELGGCVDIFLVAAGAAVIAFASAGTCSPAQTASRGVGQVKSALRGGGPSR